MKREFLVQLIARDALHLFLLFWGVWSIWRVAIGNPPGYCPIDHCRWMAESGQMSLVLAAAPLL